MKTFKETIAIIVLVTNIITLPLSPLLHAYGVLTIGQALLIAYGSLVTFIASFIYLMATER